MFAFLEGVVEEKGLNSVVLNVGGVGYMLNVSTNTLNHVVQEGERTRLHTYLYIREGVMNLYGFASKEERALFEKLISISGIGPKIALAVFSTMDTNEVVIAIVAKDDKAFSRVPGVGKKTAQRIILELAEKINADDHLTVSAKEGFGVPEGHMEREAIAGLVALGYDQCEAALAVKAACAQAKDTADLIMLALKQFDVQ
ncbi:MAG: Holliday junction branch migration protein RuvA [Christensenellales bacterium]|jgi:Holliday junction DNA helicase RuvA